MAAARILIIEDDPFSRDLVEYLLRMAGYTTFTAVNGREGVRVALAERPDLVACDLQMPIMGGYEVAREFMKEPSLQNVPMVAVTALSMSGDREKVLEAGFKGYLSKPIEPERFAQQIEDFLPPELRVPRTPSL
jgi:two-component system cell cycle response regulator DivK